MPGDKNLFFKPSFYLMGLFFKEKLFQLERGQKDGLMTIITISDRSFMTGSTGGDPYSIEKNRCWPKVGPFWCGGKEVQNESGLDSMLFYERLPMEILL